MKNIEQHLVANLCIKLDYFSLFSIAYVRYGFEGVMLAIYGSNREPLHCSEPYCHFKYPIKFLEKLDLDQGVFWIDVVSLLVFFVGLRIIGYFVLRYKVRMER